MKKKQIKLRTLWQKDCSDIWYIDFDRKGVVFKCWEVITSQTVSRFFAHGKKENFDLKCNIGDTSIFRWEVFVPFGKASIVENFNDCTVVIISTEAGPLIAASKLSDEKNNCYFGWATTPDGDEIEILWSTQDVLSLKEIALAWQKRQIEVVNIDKTEVTILTKPVA